MAKTIESRVENGKLMLNRSIFKQALQTFEGKEISITIRRNCTYKDTGSEPFLLGSYHSVLSGAFPSGMAGVSRHSADTQNPFRLVRL